MNMKNILIDIDDTLANTMADMLIHANQMFNTKHAYKDLDRSFREGNGLHGKQYQIAVGEFLKDIDRVASIKPFSNALEKLKLLHENGYRLHIASARKEQLHDITERWLKTHGFVDYIHQIHPRSSNERSFEFKVRVARDNNIQVAFDDTHDVAVALAGAGVKVYLIDKPWNTDDNLPANIIRVPDFATGVDEFLQYQKTT